MIRIKDWMSRSVATLSANKTVLDAVRMMDKNNIGSVVVLEGKLPVGIITERDIVRKIIAKGKDPAKATIDSIMTKNPKLLSEDATLLDVTRLMNKYGFRHIIITDMTGALTGMVTAKDLIKLVSV